MEISIRTMELSDVQYVHEEEQKVFGSKLSLKALCNDVMYNEATRYFIVTVDNKRAGYVGILLSTTNAEVMNLFVSLDYRELGIGKKLMTKVIDVCLEEKILMINLEVRQGNDLAIKMYEGFGFKHIKMIEKYYKNNDNAIVMGMNLGGK